MGKALIIKGADFSTNAIENINLDGKRVFTLDNADATYVGGIVWSSSSPSIIQFTESGGYTFKVYKVLANEMLVIPRQTDNIEMFFFTGGLPVAGEDKPVAFTNLPFVRVSPSSYVTEKGIAIKGDIEYYVAVATIRTVSNISYPFPDEIYVTQEYISNRTLTKENYDSKVEGRYISNSSHTWGSDTHGLWFFYNVHKGETVHIKANESIRTQYAVFSQNIQTDNGTLPNSAALEVNEEAEIPINVIGACIAVGVNLDNTNDRFPAELWTYPTPEVEESDEDSNE